MGEVYRAKDTTLGRDVAIKVLPDAFARDAQRMARFEREAKLLASLNHPNIATIHGFETSGEVRFLVMELVEGETLAERIARGPLSIEDALPIARQMTEGVEAAHENGVVHRDLKHANGGSIPQWSRDSDELFYRNGDHMMVVDYAVDGDAFVHGRPELLFEVPAPETLPYYDVTADGQRFFVLLPEEGEDGDAETERTHLTLVTRWFDEVERLVPIIK